MFTSTLLFYSVIYKERLDLEITKKISIDIIHLIKKRSIAHKTELISDKINEIKITKTKRHIYKYMGTMKLL